MHLDWPVLALAFGLGSLLSQAATLPLLLKAWGAYQREKELRIAQRVAAILADIKHTQDADDLPDPRRQRDVAEAGLFQIAKIIKDAERLRDWAAHVAAGGSPDDPPSAWKKVGIK